MQVEAPGRDCGSLRRLQLTATLAVTVVAFGCDEGDDADTSTTRPGVATSSSAATTAAAADTFCDEVIAALERELPSNGGSVVNDLRRADLSGLDAAQQAAFVLAVDHLEQAFARFNAGESPDGWSTQQVAGLASAFCGTAINYQVVTG